MEWSDVLLAGDLQVVEAVVFAVLELVLCSSKAKQYKQGLTLYYPFVARTG